MEYPAPAELDWVTARSKCTLAVMFELLRRGVESDVEIRNSLPCAGNTRFEIASMADSVSVLRLTHTGRQDGRVDFRWGENAIAVSGPGSRNELRLSATLCNDGVCRLSIDDEPLELWQVRRRALERLFFNL